MLVESISTSNIAITRTCVKNIEWDKCLYCQKERLNEKLLCPVRLSGVGYTSIAENFINFSEIDCMPFDINILEGGGGEGGVAALMKHCKNMKQNSTTPAS